MAKSQLRIIISEVAEVDFAWLSFPNHTYIIPESVAEFKTKFSLPLTNYLSPEAFY